MKMQVIIFSVVTFIFGLLLGRNYLPLGQASKPQLEKQRHYAMNVQSSLQPFWAEAREIIEQINSSGTGIKNSFGGPTNFDPAKQIEELQGLILRHVHGILLFAGDPKSLAVTIDQAFEKGIPTVALFTDVPSKRITAVVGPERESGRTIARKVLETHPEFTKTRTKVLISLEILGNPTTMERMAGVTEVLEKYPHIEILPAVLDSADDGKATEAIGAALSKNKDINVIFGLDARSAIGAVAAIKERGIPQAHVVVTGWDSDTDVLQGIKEGSIEATMVLNVRLMTAVSFALLDAYHLGYFSLPGQATTMALPEKIEIPEVLVTQENVDVFIKQKASQK